MRWMARISLGVIALVIALMVIGAVYQWRATERDVALFPMPGVLVDIGGRRLHLNCSGTGPVTVLLENGLTANYSTWLQVQRGIEATTRVCSYDRAGMGFSDPSPHPTRSESVVDDLHRLLDVAGIKPPYLLAGWSAGGVFVRRFYHDHPDDVVGMVLIDSSHEQQGTRLPRLDTAQPIDPALLTQLQLCRAIAWTGVVRVSGAMAVLSERLKLPADVVATQLALANRSDYCSGVLREIDGFPSDVVDSEPPRRLGDLPLLVLARGRASTPDEFPGAPAEFAANSDRVWSELQHELAGLSTQGRLEVAVPYGHALPLEAPDVVVEGVKTLVAQVNLGASGAIRSSLVPQVQTNTQKPAE